MKEYLQKINNGQDLLLDEMKSAINQIMSGTVSDADIESFLTGLNNKGISENDKITYTEASETSLFPFRRVLCSFWDRL